MNWCIWFKPIIKAGLLYVVGGIVGVCGAIVVMSCFAIIEVVVMGWLHTDRCDKFNVAHKLPTIYICIHQNCIISIKLKTIWKIFENIGKTNWMRQKKTQIIASFIFNFSNRFQYTWAANAQLKISRNSWATTARGVRGELHAATTGIFTFYMGSLAIRSRAQ